MSVKRSHSGSRILSVLEAIASNQPISVTALARLLDQNKSAIQRALIILADEGWIRRVSEPPICWELSAHILLVAYAAHGNNDVRRRARPILEQLRDETGETVLLAVPNEKKFVVADVIESRQALRMVPDVGALVTGCDTATWRAVLPYMDTNKQTELLGAEPNQQLLDGFAKTRVRGYAISEGEVNPVATNLAVPIFGYNGTVVAAIIVCAPRERLSASLQDAIGTMIVRAGQEISQEPYSF